MATRPSIRIGFLIFCLSLAMNSAVAKDATDQVNANSTLAVRLQAFKEISREITSEALSALGIKYRYGGNSPSTGMDCSGFVKYVFEKAWGKNLPRTTGEQFHVGEKIAKTELQPGDMVFFKTIRNRISHVGIYLGNNEFIHAPRRGEKIRVESINENYWDKRFTGARRIAPPDQMLNDPTILSSVNLDQN